MLKLSRQKNALIGGLLGGVGGGQLVILLADTYTNVHLDARQGALAAAAVSTCVLWVARPARYLLDHGVAGAWRRLMHGREKSGGGPLVVSELDTPPGPPIVLDPSSVAAIAEQLARIAGERELTRTAAASDT